jgi:hypothetical protein
MNPAWLSLGKGGESPGGAVKKCLVGLLNAVAEEGQGALA